MSKRITEYIQSIGHDCDDSGGKLAVLNPNSLPEDESCISRRDGEATILTIRSDFNRDSNHVASPELHTEVNVRRKFHTPDDSSIIEAACERTFDAIRTVPRVEQQHSGLPQLEELPCNYQVHQIRLCHMLWRSLVVILYNRLTILIRESSTHVVLEGRKEFLKSTQMNVCKGCGRSDLQGD